MFQLDQNENGQIKASLTRLGNGEVIMHGVDQLPNNITTRYMGFSSYADFEVDFKRVAVGE